MNKIAKLNLFLLSSLMIVSCNKNSSNENSSSKETSSSVSETTSSVSESKSSSISSSSSISETSSIEESSPSESSSIIEENEYAKYTKTLTKKKNEEFKILCFTDIQLHDGEKTDITLNVIDTLVNKNNPDLIVFLGDLLNDSTSYKSLVNYKTVIDKFNSFDIPFAPVLGNHDYEDYGNGSSIKTTTSNQLIDYYTSCSNCLFTRGPSNVQGKSNYIVNVVEEETNKLAETLVFMDSRLSGFDNTNVNFYENVMEYSKELNDGEVVPSVLFTHIPMYQYGDSYSYSQSVEYKDITGSINRNPCDLATGNQTLFTKIKEYGSTSMVICGHDHENAYYSDYQGIKLAYAMKSSEGDNHENFSLIGGTLVTVCSKNERIDYQPVDVDCDITSDRTIAPDTLPYWKYSGAKLVFNVKLPTTGTIRFAIFGTNTALMQNDDKTKYGAWNRLTTYETINASTKSATYGTLTQVEGNQYKYVLDLNDIDLNTSAGETACGDETARLIYFSKASDKFTFSGIRYEYEKITETNQIDLSEATIANIGDVLYQSGMKIKPEPTVTLNETTLVKGTDIIYTYENNSAKGEATLTIIPSGKGAHKYKGSKTIKFNIVTNPDDDLLPGHENAKIVNSDSYFAGNEFVYVNDWHNGKTLHMEIKPLQNGTVGTGNTVKMSLMGTNNNKDATEKGNNWARLSGYYTIDFSNNSLVIYKQGDNTAVLATGTSIGDGWFSIDIDLSKVSLNTAEGAHGNNLETLERIALTNITRSFKLDNTYIVK